MKSEDSNISAVALALEHDFVQFIPSLGNVGIMIPSRIETRLAMHGF